MSKVANDPSPIALQEELKDYADDDYEASVNYDIVFYGADINVADLVERLKTGEIFYPEFQRDFVWNINDASKFIESFLLELPVPTIFLAHAQDNPKILVVDGQQRLRSLYYFYEGYFKQSSTTFKLKNVQAQYNGKTYQTLDPKDRENLDNSLVHAIIINTENDDRSLYHVFERLNSGGQKLKPQEIRTAIYHGEFIEKIKKMNLETPDWRAIYGEKSPRRRDEELIIRFFAMLEDYEDYEPSMQDFLNTFSKKYMNNVDANIERYSELFEQCCKLFKPLNQEKPFRLDKTLNAAFFEAAMVGLARVIEQEKELTPENIENVYQKLIQDEKFIQAISEATANKTSVKERIDTAIKFFSGMEIK